MISWPMRFELECPGATVSQIVESGQSFGQRERQRVSKLDPLGQQPIRQLGRGGCCEAELVQPGRLAENLPRTPVKHNSTLVHHEDMVGQAGHLMRVESLLSIAAVK